MQLIPRYLVPNRVTIVIDQAGFVTEFRPVYSRNVTVYKGIDNTIQFRVLNADQKPIDVTGYVPRFVAFNNRDNVIIEHEGEVIDDSSASHRGLFTVTITEQELLDIPQQYLSYNIYLVDSTGHKTLTYSHSNFDNDATIFVSGDAFPGPRETTVIKTFQLESSQSEVWYSELAQVYPANNTVDRMHTIVVYPGRFVGTIEVEGTLNNTTDNADWAPISSITTTGYELEPVYMNVTGAFSFLRFKTDIDPDPIEQILVRT